MNNSLPKGGYMGKILRVDLSNHTVDVETPDSRLLAGYIGGSGLGIRLLYSETKAGIDPLSPENKIIFSTGPFTGTLIPGSGTYSVASKNTLTGFAATCHSNGFFGGRLKNAGFDAVVIQGCSDKLVYLYINNGKASIEEATNLAGKGTLETQRRPQEKIW